MRVVEKKMLNAIVSKKNLTLDNTMVVTEGNVSCVYLFNNLIAKITDKNVKISNCGYKTITTKSRLNCILQEFVKDARIHQKNFDWYIGNEIFPKGWIEFPNKFLLNSFAK
jgi:hypothetical protein